MLLTPTAIESEANCSLPGCIRFPVALSQLSCLISMMRIDRLRSRCSLICRLLATLKNTSRAITSSRPQLNTSTSKWRLRKKKLITLKRFSARSTWPIPATFKRFDLSSSSRDTSRLNTKKAKSSARFLFPSLKSSMPLMVRSFWSAKTICKTTG